jgi:hypothetical protein
MIIAGRDLSLTEQIRSDLSMMMVIVVDAIAVDSSNIVVPCR